MICVLCRRQRAYTAPATPHYHLVADSLVVSSDSAQFDVKNTKYDICEYRVVILTVTS